MITISTQTIRAAMANPSNALGYELGAVQHWIPADHPIDTFMMLMELIAR